MERVMAGPYIINGAKVEPIKVQRSRELRKSSTPEEAILWDALRGQRLAGLGFRRQQIIRGIIVDFYCHAASLVLEIDGGVHKTQAEYDRERDQILRIMGLKALRITNREVGTDLDTVLARIRDTVSPQRTPAAGFPGAGKP